MCQPIFTIFFSGSSLLFVGFFLPRSDRPPELDSSIKVGEKMKYFLKNYADSNPALSKHLFHSSHNDTSGNAASSSSSESDDDHDDNEPCTSGEKVSCDSDDGDAHHTRLLQQSILSANEWSGSRRKYAKLLMIFARQQYGDEAVLNATVSNGGG